MVIVRDIVKLLLSQQGDKYVFGKEVSSSEADPDAFDCSELIEWGCNRLNVSPKMPDGTWIQASHCKKYGTLVSVEKGILTPGALIFIFSSTPFEDNRPDRAHVAMSLGNGMTIEARSTKYGVGVFSVENRGWTHAALIPGVSY